MAEGWETMTISNYFVIVSLHVTRKLTARKSGQSQELTDSDSF